MKETIFKLNPTGMSDVSKKYATKELSKLGKLLQQRGISQIEFIEMINDKFPHIVIAKSQLSLHVNGKREFMTTDTAKIFAQTLGVPMEDVC